MGRSVPPRRPAWDAVEMGRAPQVVVIGTARLWADSCLMAFGKVCFVVAPPRLLYELLGALT